MTVPTDIANLELWLRADSVTGLNSGDALTTWNDSSGNGRNVTQGTAASKPLWYSGRVGGKPAIYFDGSNDWLENTAGVMGFNGNTGLTVFVVYELKTALPTNGGLISKDDFSVPNRGWSTFIYSDTDQGLLIPTSSSTREIRRGLTPGGTFARPMMYTGRFQGSTEQSLWFNGTLDNDTITGSIPASIGNAGTTNLWVGRTGASGEYLLGYIAEIVVYSTNLSDTNRQAIETYLRNKYLLPEKTDTFQSPNISAQQGYATDGTYHYTIETTALRKRDNDGSWTLLASNTTPFSSLSGTPNHIGDGHCYNGKLYVPVENYTNCSTFSAQQIAVYNTSDLSYSTHADVSAQAHECAGLCIDPNAGEIYVVSYCDGTKIWRYALSDLSYIGSISLDRTIVNAQGITYKSGYFYIADTDGDLWRVTKGGSVDWLFNQGSAYTEYEGVDWSTDTLRWLMHESGSTYKVHYFKLTTTAPEQPRMSANVRVPSQAGVY